VDDWDVEVLCDVLLDVELIDVDVLLLVLVELLVEVVVPVPGEKDILNSPVDIWAVST
jgi:hypothetical protein